MGEMNGSCTSTNALHATHCLYLIHTVTCGLASEGLFEGRVVDADPHPGLSSLQLHGGESTPAQGREEACRVRPRGRQRLWDRHGAQLAALTEPAEGDDVRMKARGLGCHVHNAWREKTFCNDAFTSFALF